MVDLLIEARKEAGLTQREVAKRLKRPPSFIGKAESLQRRLDAVELIDILEAIGASPQKFIGALGADLRKRK